MAAIFKSKAWVRAYWLLCAWFGINYSVYFLARYFTTSPFATTLYNGLFIFVILCLLIYPIWKWCQLVSSYNIPIQVLAHIISVVAWFFVMGSVYYFFEYYLDNFQSFEEWQEYLTQTLGSNPFQLYYGYITAVFVYYLIDYTDRLKAQEKQKRDLALQNQEMQLSLLKSQINPHFLFNTLNSISMLIGTNKDRAREMINRLSQVFRYALDSYDDQTVTLAEELKFTENYLSIQKVRFEERLVVVEDVDKSCYNLQVPAMVLQPIVENSIKHGIAPKDEGGTIEIRIRQNDSFVYFEVADNGLGINANKTIGEHGKGVGLAVSDQRLRKMYGEDSKLHLDADSDGFRVRFKIPMPENGRK